MRILLKLLIHKFDPKCEVTCFERHPDQCPKALSPLWITTLEILRDLPKFNMHKQKKKLHQYEAIEWKQLCKQEMKS